MNWKNCAIEDLRMFGRRKASLDNIRGRMRALKDQCGSVKCALGSDSTPVQGGGSQIEDRMLSNIVERQRLGYTYAATKRLVDLTERGLQELGDQERTVLERMYVSRERGAVERLMEELGYEQAQVYRIKNQALYNFTVHQYGLVDY